jgi:hypothetical protein
MSHLKISPSGVFITLVPSGLSVEGTGTYGP